MKKSEEDKYSSESKFGWTEDDLIFLDKNDEEEEKDEQDEQKNNK